MPYFHHVVMAAILVAMTGCSQSVIAANQAQADLDKPKVPAKWPDRFAEAEAAKPLPSPQKLYPFQPNRWAFEQFDATGKTKDALVQITKDEEDKDYPWRRHTPDGRIEHIGQNKDGAWVIAATVDLKHAAKTIYDPPFVLLPAQLAVGKKLEFKSKMTVQDANNPKIIRDRGTCTRELSCQAMQWVHTQAGRYHSYRLHSTIEAKLGLATVKTQSTIWYAPGMGPVAAHHHERVQTAILIGWESQDRWMLRHPKPLPPPQPENDPPKTTPAPDDRDLDRPDRP